MELRLVRNQAELELILTTHKCGSAMHGIVNKRIKTGALQLCLKGDWVVAWESVEPTSAQLWAQNTVEDWEAFELAQL